MTASGEGACGLEWRRVMCEAGRLGTTSARPLRQDEDGAGARETRGPEPGRLRPFAVCLFLDRGASGGRNVRRCKASTAVETETGQAHSRDFAL